MDLKHWMVLMLFFAIALMLYAAVLSYRKRNLHVARTMVWVMLAAVCYAGGYAFELLSPDLRGVKWAMQVQYLGIPFVTVLWLVLVLQFTGTAARFRRRLAGGLFVIPVATFLLHLTNDWHHLVYTAYIPNVNAEFPAFITDKGPWYTVSAIYNYLSLGCGISLIIPMFWRSLPVMRKQIVLLFLGAAAPVIFNIAYSLNRYIDFTPLGFAVTGLLSVWGIYRFNLLRLTPLALAKVFDTVRDGVVLLDYEDRVVSCNVAAEDIFPELCGTSRYPAPAIDILSAFPDLLQRISSASGSDERFSFTLVRENKIRHYNCSLNFIHDAGNGTAPIGKMLLFNDITELKENEARLREYAEQLSQLNAFKDKLFTVVAHDIRDPIAHLVSLTELLGEETAAAEDIQNAEVFHEIKGQVRSTFQLVDNLLDWYRSQRGEIAFRPMVWNLQQVVHQAMALAGTRAGRKRIQLQEQIDGTLTVNADKEMLDFIFRNLLSNAIKFTGVGGRIEVGAVPEGDYVQVYVKDNGTGIDDQTSLLLRQEELFFRVPVMDNEGGDARFGLVLTREFLRIHGGSLRFDSVPGEGTTFYITLPRMAGSGSGNMNEETKASGETAVKFCENDID